MSLSEEKVYSITWMQDNIPIKTYIYTGSTKLTIWQELEACHLMSYLNTCMTVEEENIQSYKHGCDGGMRPRVHD